MEKVIEFIRANNVGAVATSLNNQPYVRPQHVHFINEGKFYFTTANTKKAYEQMKENPIIEFMTSSAEFVTVRLRGEIIFATDMPTKEMIIDNCPLVKMGYKTADNPTFEVFYIEHGQAIMSDFSGQAPQIFEF